MSTTRRRLLVVGLVVVLVAAAVIVYVTLTSKKEPVVEVTFPDATGVTLGYQVRSRGALVGKVSDVRVVNGQAILGLDVEGAGVLPLRQDASAWIRPLNLLGERYIELEPGTPTAPELAKPYRIGPEHTRTSVGLQDVLNTLDAPTATSVATAVTTLGEGVADAGPQAADAVKALAPAMTDTGRLAGILNQQNAILNQLIDRTSPVAAAVGAEGSKPLDQLIGTTNQTLQTVTANRQAIDETIAELPSTLVSARRTLDQLAGTARAATPTLASLRPVTGNLKDIAREVDELAKTADPAVASLRPVVDRADELLDQAAPAVAQLRPIGPELKSAAKNLEPVGIQLLDKHLRDLLDFVRLWSLSTNGRDALSNYFRGVIHVTPQYLQVIAGDVPVTGIDPGLLAKPLASTQIPGAAALFGQAGQASRGLAGALNPGGQQPAPASPPAAGGTAPAGPQGAAVRNQDPTNATGLSPEQEQSMLGQMIGGR